jgi:hypothetical protein
VAGCRGLLPQTRAPFTVARVPPQCGAGASILMWRGCPCHVARVPLCPAVAGTATIVPGSDLAALAAGDSPHLATPPFRRGEEPPRFTDGSRLQPTDPLAAASLWPGSHCHATLQTGSDAGGESEQTTVMAVSASAGRGTPAPPDEDPFAT